MAASIQIKLYATLRANLPPNADHYPIDPETTVHQIVAALCIPEDLAKLVFVNGIKGSLKTPLKDGDRLGIFPPVGGG